MGDSDRFGPEGPAKVAEQLKLILKKPSASLNQTPAGKNTLELLKNRLEVLKNGLAPKARLAQIGAPRCAGSSSIGANVHVIHASRPALCL